ncbi:6-phosphogluconolactonase [Legionella lytica]|uniref:6-phosphogluconolactonase n=1 Tax=Legionella lytica TaxID=96232 RepID=A0ABW8DCD5_9GAMM
MQLHSFGDADLLVSDLVSQLKRLLLDAITQRGQAYLVVSGGKTPADLFQALAKVDLPWSKVTITLADERCVPLDDTNSNERMLRQLLLQHEAKAARFVSLYSQTDPDLHHVKQDISALPTFDVVILGMGDDGHTASLFPSADELNLGLDENAPAVLFVNPKTSDLQRVSLSKRRLLDSRVIFLHLKGQNKLAVLHQAMAQPDPMLMPISAFLNSPQADVQVMYAP